MQYTRIDWEHDFVWESIVVQSTDYPVNALLFNAMIPELRKKILSYLDWMDEMRVFEQCPALLHPWGELAARYGVRDQSWV